MVMSSHRLGQADVHGVGSFHHDDAGIVAELPIEDAVAGINREDFGCAALEEAIGKPAGAASEIGADFSRDGRWRKRQARGRVLLRRATRMGHRYIVIGLWSFVICDGETPWRSRQLGRSGVRVTPIVFGAWAIGGWLWGGTNDRDALEAIRASIDNGVTTIDTAAIYGFGHSEKLVGQAIKGRREKVVIATKCGMRWDALEGSDPWPQKDGGGKELVIRKNSRPEGIVWECEQSLMRLGIDVIDLYQIHRPDVDTPVEESMRAMEKLRQQGKIRAIGVSNFEPGMADARRCGGAAGEQSAAVQRDSSGRSRRKYCHGAGRRTSRRSVIRRWSAGCWPGRLGRSGNFRRGIIGRGIGFSRWRTGGELRMRFRRSNRLPMHIGRALRRRLFSGRSISPGLRRRWWGAERRSRRSITPRR